MKFPFGLFLGPFGLISGSFLARTRTKSFVDVNDSVHLVESNDPYSTKYYLDMNFPFGLIFGPFGLL